MVVTARELAIKAEASHLNVADLPTLANAFRSAVVG